MRCPPRSPASRASSWGCRRRRASSLRSCSPTRRPPASTRATGVAAASWRDFGAIILVGALDDAVPLVDALAPEHLEIATADPERLAGKIRNAGAIFLGPHTPEAIGDYVGGSNHVLPTARSARFSSGLSVLDFMKRTSILKCGPDQLRALGPAAMTLGQAEGLEAHSRSIGLRLNLP